MDYQSTWNDGAASNTSGIHVGRRKFPIHTTFYWGHKAEILFTDWPGNSSAMYALAIILVFGLAVLVEWLTHTGFGKTGASDVASRLMNTSIHSVRSGLSYLVILAVMSFNGGVFLAALGGHALGFLIFRTRAIRKEAETGSGKPSGVLNSNPAP